MKTYFVTNLVTNKIIPATRERLKNDIAFWKVKTPMAINKFSIDAYVHLTEKAASEFLTKFGLEKAKLKLLINKGETLKGQKCFLMKRHYLVSINMGLKNNTVRNRDIGIKRGEKMYFHDQKHFVAVKIKSVKQLEDGKFQYNFERK